MNRKSIDRRGHSRWGARTHRAPVLAGALLLALVADAEAVDIFWRNPSGGTFSSNGSWIGSVVPGANDVAHFGLTVPTFPPSAPQSYTVSFSLDATNQRVVVEDDGVTFDLNGRVYRTPTSGNQIGTVGQTGRLTLLDGLWDDTGTGNLDIGVNGASGGLTISTGGQFVGKRINVGAFGSGTLTVQNGGSVESTFIPIGLGASGVVSVTGANSTIVTAALNVGALSPGTLSIAAGGRFQNSGACNVGDGFDDDPGVVNVDGANSLWTSAGVVKLGRQGNATVAITSGAHADLGNTFIGSVEPGNAGTGSVTISGANSQLITGGLHIGFIGSGELHVADGALARNTGTDLEIGREAQGEIEITSGGRLEAVNCTLGDLTAEGTATVSGAGSQWINSGTLHIGEFAPGVVTIADQGVVQNSNGFVGFGDPVTAGAGVVTVDGIDSQWINQGDLSVGHGRNGTLTLTNRGKVTSVNGWVGRLATNVGGVDVQAMGAVTVDGPGSEWVNSGELTVGDVGMGTLNITASGLVRSSSAIVGKSAGGTGAVTVDGANSLWSNSADVHVGTAGQGVVSLANGGKVFAQNVAIDPFGTLQGNGAIIGSLQNNGLVAPGASIGALAVTGAYTQQAGGVLEIEIGGSSASHVDLLTVGAATLDGELRLSLVAGIIPAVNVALTATSLSGQFDNIVSGQRLSTIDGGGSFIVHYGPGSPFNPNQIVLTAFQSFLSADFDDDGDVDSTDLVIWNGAFDLNQLGDADGDNDSDGNDFLLWQRQLGSIPAVAAAAAVPEPNAAILAFAGLMVGISLYRVHFLSRRHAS